MFVCKEPTYGGKGCSKERKERRGKELQRRAAGVMLDLRLHTRSKREAVVAMLLNVARIRRADAINGENTPTQWKRKDFLVCTHLQ